MKNALNLEQLQQRITVSPFNRWLGLTAESIDADGVVLTLVRREELIGNPKTGVLHGGLMGCLVDAACAFAVIAQTGQSVATVDFRVDFHRASIAPQLWARGRILKTGRTLATVEGHVYEKDGTLVASGRAVMLHSQLKSEAP
jgi:uncharacterized protein (TIGR00369 family)